MPLKIVPDKGRWRVDFRTMVASWQRPSSASLAVYVTPGGGGVSEADSSPARNSRGRDRHRGSRRDGPRRGPVSGRNIAGRRCELRCRGPRWRAALRQIGRWIIRWRVRRGRRPGRRRAIGHPPRNLVAARVHALRIGHVVVALRLVVRIAIGTAAGGAAEGSPVRRRSRRLGQKAVADPMMAPAARDSRADQRVCRGAVRGVLLHGRATDGGACVLLARHLVRLELLEAFCAPGSTITFGPVGTVAQPATNTTAVSGINANRMSMSIAGRLRHYGNPRLVARLHVGNNRRGRCSNTNSSTARPAAA